MDDQVIAVIFQEVGRFASVLFSHMPHRTTMPPADINFPEIDKVQPPVAPKLTPAKVTSTTMVTPAKVTISEDKTSGTACIPCAIGHLGTCTGLLNESMRFAREKGVDSNDVIDRVNKCLDELNAMERVDLSSENIADLSPWEKELAIEALNLSRNTRHGIEHLSGVGDLEEVTVNTQRIRQHLGQEWFKQKLKRMSPEEKTKLKEKVGQRLKVQEVQDEA